MSFRTLTIFVEEGHDIILDLHGQFARWELESILVRTMEKVQESDIDIDITEEVISQDEDGKEIPD